MKTARSELLLHYWSEQSGSGCRCCRWPALGHHWLWGGLMKLSERGFGCCFVGWWWPVPPVMNTKVGVKKKWINVMKISEGLMRWSCATCCVGTAAICCLCCCLCWAFSCLLCCIWLTECFWICTWTCFSWRWFFCWLCCTCPWVCLSWFCWATFCWLCFCWVSWCCANLCCAWSCFCWVCWIMSRCSCCCCSRVWASFLGRWCFRGFGLPSVVFCICTWLCCAVCFCSTACWTCSRWICCSLSNVSWEHWVGWTIFLTWASSVIPSISSSQSTSFFTFTERPFWRFRGWRVEAFSKVCSFMSGDVMLFSLLSFSNTVPPANFPCSSWERRVSTSLCFCLNILVSSSICLSFSWSIWSLSMVSDVYEGRNSEGWQDAAKGLARLHELWTSSLTCERGCDIVETGGCWGEGCKVSWVRGELTISPNMSPLQLVSSGLSPASDLSDGVGDTGGLELVLPNLMTRPGTIWVKGDNANLNPTSPGCCSVVETVVGGVVKLLTANVCWPGWGLQFLEPFCSW